MTTTLRIVADDVEAKLDAQELGAGALIRVQSAALAAGPFADLTGDTTVPLVAGTRYYRLGDPAGTASTWYQTRYEDAGGTNVSAWSDPFQVASSRALCTVDDAKARLLDAGESDTVDDGLLAELIDQVSAEIEDYSGRRLTPDDGATYTLDTDRGHVLPIRQGVRAVTLLEVAGTDQPDTGGTYDPVDADAILLRPVELHRRPGWPPDTIVLLSSPLSVTIPLGQVTNGARVTGDFGFAATPAWVVRIATAAVVRAYLDRKRSGRAGQDGFDLPGILDPGELAALARLRGVTGIA